MAGTALNSLVMMTAGTDEIVMTVDTTRIAGVKIAEVTATMVNELTEVIDTGAGTVQRWGLPIYVCVYWIFWYDNDANIAKSHWCHSEGGSGAAVMGLMKDTTRMVITLSMITEETSWREGEQDHHAPGSAHEHFRGRCKMLLSPPPKSSVL